MSNFGAHFIDQPKVSNFVQTRGELMAHYRTNLRQRKDNIARSGSMSGWVRTLVTITASEARC
jgi:hypothetical protein